MKEIRCKVHLFTFENYTEDDAPENCVKYVDTIDEQYQMVSLTDEQFEFLMNKTEEEIAEENNPHARPDFEGLRDDFTDIFNGIATPLLEIMRRLFEEDGCAQIWIDEALERIGISVCQDCCDDEGDLFPSYGPIEVKNGILYNYPFGERHMISFFEEHLSDEELAELNLS